jgi:hypothetical protein
LKKIYKIIFGINWAGVWGARGQLDSKNQNKNCIKNHTIIYPIIYENRPKILLFYEPRLI